MNEIQTNIWSLEQLHDCKTSINYNTVVADPLSSSGELYNIVDNLKSSQELKSVTERYRSESYFNPSITLWNNTVVFASRGYLRGSTPRRIMEAINIHVYESVDAFLMTSTSNAILVKDYILELDYSTLIKRSNHHMSTRSYVAGEDPRLIAIDEKLYAIYNIENTLISEGRHMAYCEITFSGGRALVKQNEINIMKLDNGLQKNWVPFEFNKTLYFSYTIYPHIVVRPARWSSRAEPAEETNDDFMNIDIISYSPKSHTTTTITSENDKKDNIVVNGNRYNFEVITRQGEQRSHSTIMTMIEQQKQNIIRSENIVIISWAYGAIRGGSPAIYVPENKVFLAIFHSSYFHYDIESVVYYMGAYIYESQPPFEILAHSKVPILPKGLYSGIDDWKHIIFPSGILRIKDDIFISIGYNDTKGYIYKIGLEKILNSLVPTNITQ